MTTVTAPLPLTTTFSPPVDCTTDTYHILWSTSSDYTWWWLSLGVTDSASCFPSGYQPTSYFSPGVCPDGYTAAGQSYISSADETQATCCPSFYNAQTGNDWPWYTTNPCTSSNTDKDNVHSFTGSTTVSTETGAYGVNAKGISIRWKESDFATSTTTTTTSGATSDSKGTSSTTARNKSTATGTTDNQTSTGTSGLSTGAKAGIGIGAAAGVIALLAVIFFIYRSRRKSVYDPINRPSDPRETESRPIYEANAHAIHEIDSRGAIVEAYAGVSETQQAYKKPDSAPVELATYR